jgi:hypothetical protein
MDHFSKLATFANLTRYVNVIFDAAAQKITFVGDCNDQGGVRVDIGAPTEIWLLFWTINIPVQDPPIQPAILTALNWPDGQPNYVESDGTQGTLPEGQINPQWILIDNYLDNDETGIISYHLEITYRGVVFGHDPTIINVDPPKRGSR